MTNYEFMLQDRIAKIQAINEQYDLEKNAYISFSGGKDSTILSYLIDLALPNNNIPRLFLNTGIEYMAIVKYVKDLARKDNRFIVYNVGVNIKEMLEKDGYPFKSKEHSHHVGIYQKSGIHKSVSKYLKLVDTDKRITCPKALKYQFTEEFKIPVSDRCCINLKKTPAKHWAKANNKSITLTGMRQGEQGQRLKSTCIVLDKDNQLTKFHPLLVIDKEFEEEFIKQNNIQLCELYYPPYNFDRTGCKGCPFALDLQEQLNKMEELLPNERKQCELIWGKVYKEYRRIGYRLNTNKQMSIFDLKER